MDPSLAEQKIAQLAARRGIKPEDVMPPKNKQRGKTSSYKDFDGPQEMHMIKYILDGTMSRTPILIFTKPGGSISGKKLKSQIQKYFTKRGMNWHVSQLFHKKKNISNSPSVNLKRLSKDAVTIVYLTPEQKRLQLNMGTLPRNLKNTIIGMSSKKVNKESNRRNRFYKALKHYKARKGNNFEKIDDDIYTPWFRSGAPDTLKSFIEYADAQYTKKYGLTPKNYIIGGVPVRRSNILNQKVRNTSFMASVPPVEAPIAMIFSVPE